MIPVTLTIAGSDCGGGAGIQADLKTFQELQTFGTSVITALTAQNTLGVHDVQAVPSDFVIAQLNAILDDFDVSAIKTGMLFSSDIIRAVSERLQQEKTPLIIDPVMIAKGGATLLKTEAMDAMITHLLPLATILTPNIPEAEQLTNTKITTIDDVHQAAALLLQMGPEMIIMKGGHIAEDHAATDRLYFKDGRVLTYSSQRIATKDTHGTGCTFSAAITAGIAYGLNVDEAIKQAKDFIFHAISDGLGIGHGHGPTNHFAFNNALRKTGDPDAH